MKHVRFNVLLLKYFNRVENKGCNKSACVSQAIR